jgi:hypothetical protein
LLSQGHFHSLNSNQTPNCHESRQEHSLIVDWLRSLFLHRLQRWVSTALKRADCYPRWDLNQDQNRW